MDTDIRVSEYQSREALDRDVLNLKSVGSVPARLRIVGTTDELKRLHLSHGLSVHGVPAVASDYQPKPTTRRPMRGETKPFGINGDLRDEKGKPAKKP